MSPTPLGTVARGLVAGAIGTAAMTAWQELSMKLQDSGGDDGQDGGGEQGDPWEQAPVPARVARRVLDGVFGVELPPERIELVTNVMHWGYGTGWGALFGLVQETRAGPTLRRGLLFGVGVWSASYVQLVPMDLYQPPWKYPPKELAMDVSYHLAYGAGLGAGYAALER